MAGERTGVVPQGDAIRNALRWLDERVQEEPGVDRAKLVGQASVRFDLSPLEEEFLLTRWLSAGK